MAEAPDILTSRDGMAFVPIEEKHGDDCTCRFAARIELDLVMASRACPGDRNPHRGGTIAAQLEPLEPLEPTPYPGFIAITWPAPTSNGTPLPTWPMQVHDLGTGEQLVCVSGLRMVLGGDNWDTETVFVDLRMLIDENGKPLAMGMPVARDESGAVRRATFRCYIAEMRILPTDPSIPTRESVARGEHTIDEYRKHHVLDNDTQEEHQP
jgi:hypothetical protein